MLFNKEHPWRLAISGWGAFILATILYQIFDTAILNKYFVLGLLTAAIILTIGNAIYLFYKKQKSNEEIG